ncbi:MAG: class I SAM-dependent methyltransferase [Actinomycetota bacterium]
MDATTAERSSVSTPEHRLDLVPVRCPLCGEYEAEPVAVGNDLAEGTTPECFLAVSCRGCGLVYLNPRPRREERARFWPRAGTSAAQPGWRTPEARRIAREALRLCGRLPGNARVLEVGYGARLHLTELRDAAPSGWTFEGVTPHVELALAARQAGFAVHEGDARVMEPLGLRYHAVLLLHALECRESPVGELTALRGLLAPGGRLIILSHNVESAVGRIFQGRHWAGYDFPRHLALLGPRVMPRLAEGAGLEMERLRTLGNSRIWARSAANLLRDWNAPAWLNRWVDREAFPFGGLGRLAEGVSQRRGKGAVLAAMMRRREESAR